MSTPEVDQRGCHVGVHCNVTSAGGFQSLSGKDYAMGEISKVLHGADRVGGEQLQTSASRIKITALHANDNEVWRQAHNLMADGHNIPLIAPVQHKGHINVPDHLAAAVQQFKASEGKPIQREDHSNDSVAPLRVMAEGHNTGPNVRGA